MVVIPFVPTELTRIKHERMATPSRCTVQAPHNPLPQPYLVPVSPSESRSTHSSGVSGSPSNSTDCALTDSEKCVTRSGVLASTPWSQDTRCAQMQNSFWDESSPVGDET